MLTLTAIVSDQESSEELATHKKCFALKVCLSVP